MQKGQTSKKVSSLVLGSSMVLMSLLPAASAFAATSPTLTMTGPSSVKVSTGGSATFTVSGSGLASNEEYQFWIQTPSGKWQVAQNYSSNNSFTINNAQSGNYLVEAYAMTPAQIKAHDWSAAVSSNNGQSDGIFVGSTVTTKTVVAGTSTPATDVAPGTQITATASSTGVYHPQYQFWVEAPSGHTWGNGSPWKQLGTYTTATHATFTAPWSGNYKVVAYAKSPLGLNNQNAALMSNESTPAAYGSAATVQLSPSSSSVVADGKATDTITATVVDSNGNVVKNFNGYVAIKNPSSYFSLSPALYGSGTYRVSNGVAQFNVTSPVGDGGKTATLSAEYLTNSNFFKYSSNINMGTGITVTSKTPAATGLSVSPASSVLANNSSSNSDALTVNITDQANNPYANSTPRYVTLTLSGDASFAPVSSGGSAKKTWSGYITTGDTVPIYPIKGTGTGTSVSVSASANGLHSGSASVHVVEAQKPATLQISKHVSSQTNTAGVPYTIYTVQMVDANGNPVAPSSSDSLAISDNSKTYAPLYYHEVHANGTVSGTSMSASNVFGSLTKAQSTQWTTTGKLQFAAVNHEAAGTSPTISIKDSATKYTGTASYQYQVGSPTQALTLMSPTEIGQGQTVHYTFQIADAYNNPIAASGHRVDVAFWAYTGSANSAGATIAGSDAWNISNPYVTSTNSSGQVTIPISIPSSAKVGTTFSGYASVPGEKVGTRPFSGTVQAPATTASGLALSSSLPSSAGSPITPLSWPSKAMTASQTLSDYLTGSSTASVYALPENGSQGWTGNSDTVKITSSDSSVLGISTSTSSGNWTDPNGNTGTVSTVTGSSSNPLPTITASAPGSATLTITDTSVSGVSTSHTITVNVGAPYQAIGVNPNGSTDSAYTFGSSGVSGPFTVQVQDIAGNNVALNNGPMSITASEVESMLGVSGVKGIRLSSTGADVNNVTIPNGSSSVQVWVDGVTKNTSTTPTSATVLKDKHLGPAPVSASVTGSTLTVKFNDALQAMSSTDLTTLASSLALTDSGSTTSTAPTISNVSVSGSTLTATLSASPSHGSTYTLGYTRQTSSSTPAADYDTLVNGYGAYAPSFSSFSVTNNN